MAFIDGEDTAADDLGGVGGGVEAKGEDGDDNLGEATDGENHKEHNEKLERHRGAADDGDVGGADEFWDGEPL